KIVCYFGSWAVYRPGLGAIDVNDIDPRLCTHLIYTFVGINTDGSVKINDPWADLPDGGGKNGYGKFTALRNRSPGTKAMIAVGGWNEGSNKFSQVVSNPGTRARFVQNVVDFLRKYNFDGFDVDWEYPNQRGGQPSDKQNFVNLLRELKSAFSPHGYILSVAVAAVASSASQSYNIRDVAEQVDFVNLMAYDMNGSWNSFTGENAPLYSNDPNNVNAAVRYWLSQGASPNKLILGIPSYGRSFTLANAGNNGIGAPAVGPGTVGPYTREAGMLGYNEICEKLRQGGWTINRDGQQLVPYMVQGNQWVGYDDVQSIREKAKYINSLNLGGAMLWSIETDDFRGVCGQRYPLLSVLNSALNGGAAPAPAPVPNPTPTSAPQPPPQPPSGSVCNKEGYKFTVVFLAVFVAMASSGKKKIVGYFGSWAVYRPGLGAIDVTDIDPRLCTHLIYAFVGINADGSLKIHDPWADLPDGGGKNGYGKYNFDGLDVDWEYPNQRGGVPSDKQNFVNLLKELKSAFRPRGYILSVAVAAVASSASQSYNIRDVAEQVDFVNLMTYDMNGSWNSVIGQNAPLYSSDGNNVHDAVRHWLSQGASPNKLILGIPTYGRSFTLANAGNCNIGARASGPGAVGPYTKEAGMLGYNEICEKLRQGGWTVSRDAQQLVPYMYQGNQWVGYDDVQSVREKAKYINSYHLGGGMIWSLETDDFRGVCGQKYPLLRALHSNYVKVAHITSKILHYFYQLVNLCLPGSLHPSNAVANYWLSQGAPADKIIIGMPFYGISFTLRDANKHGTHSPVSGKGTVNFADGDGNINYNSLCTHIHKDGWTIVRDQKQRVPYCYKGNQWISYDDVESIREKAEYVKNHNLGGAMVWSMDTDDFAGKCGPKHPLLNVINNVLRKCE
ncbi:putative chitinase 3, partial [Dufourea novaeangliae]